MLKFILKSILDELRYRKEIEKEFEVDNETYI